MSAARKKLLLTASGLALAVVFFFLYSFLPLSAPEGLYNSPDENSNAVFAGQYAADGRLYRIDELNLRPSLENLVHPRSVRVVDGFQVPGGFIGLPLLYGLGGKVLGQDIIPFMTPLLALLGVLAWGLILARLFGRRVGWLGALLLLVQPAWWYWTARTMMPNTVFVSLLLISVAFLVAEPLRCLAIRLSGGEKIRLLGWSDAALSGIFLALALAVRPVELYWIVLAGLVLALVLRSLLPWSRIAVAFVFCLLAWIPFLVFNQSLYGSWSATGYGGLETAVPSTVHGGLGARLLGPLRPWLFPLGFAPRTALANFWTYGLKFFWWWTLTVAVSGVLVWRWRRTVVRFGAGYAIRAFAWASLAVVVWLALFYGSWVVQDNPDPTAVSIGSSYLRYWLPLFVLSTLPVALALKDLTARRRGGRLLAGTVVMVLALLGGSAVYGSSQEGLTAVRSNLYGYMSDTRTVLSLTEEEAIVIADRADKTLYPHRSVIYPLRSESTYAALPGAAAARPLYYYGLTLPPVDLEYLRSTYLYPAGLEIEAVQSIGQNTLYRIFFTQSLSRPST